MEDNVIQMPDRLERLAKRIRDALAAQAENRAAWIESTVELCSDAAMARAEFKANDLFGDWWDKQGFCRPDGTTLNRNERAAAVEMGGDPDHLRKVLSGTMKVSLRTIRDNEWRLHTPVKTTSRRSGNAHRHAKADAAIADLKAEGKPITENEVHRRSGVSSSTVHTAVAVERAKEEARAEVDEETLAKAAEAALPKTSKEKLDLAIKYAMKRLEAEFSERVRLQSLKNDEEKWKPITDEKLALYQAVVAGRDGVFTKAEYSDIMRCLHPDHVATLGAEWAQRHNEAFRLFREAEVKLLDNKESPQTDDSPWTLDNLLKRREAAKAERAAKRTVKPGN
jgi:hypothetical protein